MPHPGAFTSPAPWIQNELDAWGSITYMQVCEAPGEPATALAETLTEFKLLPLRNNRPIVAMKMVGFGVAKSTSTHEEHASPPSRVGETATFTVFPETV